MRQTNPFSFASPAVGCRSSSGSDGSVDVLGVGAGGMIAAQVGGLAAMSGEAMKRAAAQIINCVFYQDHRLVQWPWYAAPMCGALASTFGDVGIDSRLHVRLNYGDHIPDLYAARNFTCGVECGPCVGCDGGLIKARAFDLPCAHDLTQARRPAALQ